jgi:hypothetical protein
MKKLISLMFLILFTFACAPAPTPKIVVVTVVFPPTMPLETATPVTTGILPPTLTFTPNPCLRWDQVTIEMKGSIVCVRGIIRKIDISHTASHWNFTDNRTGFFATSSYMGWHPITGKDMSVGD